jgi:manganese transport protein
VLNAKLVYDAVADWAEGAGQYGWLVWTAAAPLVAGLGLLLAWMIVRREKPAKEELGLSAAEVVAAAAPKRFHRIAVALEAMPSDSAMLAEAIALAKQHHAELLLIHVVDGVGGRWYGPQTGDAESRHDEAYLAALTQQLAETLVDQGVPKVESVLGFGNPPSEIVSISRQYAADLVILGGHGHKPVLDLLHGETISGVRHGLNIPVMTVR